METSEQDQLNNRGVQHDRTAKDVHSPDAQHPAQRPRPLKSPGPVVLDVEFAMPCPLGDTKADSILGDDVLFDSVEVAQFFSEMDVLLQNHSNDMRCLLRHHLQKPGLRNKLNSLHGHMPEYSPVQHKPRQQNDHMNEREWQHERGEAPNEATTPDNWNPLHKVTRFSMASGVRNGDKTANKIKDKKAQTKVFVDDCIADCAKKRVLAKQTPLQSITRSAWYEWASGVLIMGNAAYMGVQTEFMARQARHDAELGLMLPPPEPAPLVILSCLFTFLFTLDLLTRWVSEGLFDFLRREDWSWCLFDIFIVALSVFDSAFSLWSWSAGQTGDNMLGSFTVLRVLRVLRVVKIAKVIRVMGFFRELRMMIYSILGCMKSLTWTVLILCMTFYIFSITFVSGVTSSLDRSEQWSDVDTAGLREHFGSIDSSFLTLYMAMAGGRSWGEYYHFLAPIPGQYRFFFLAFLTFTIFAVLNIVTGICVDSALQASNACRQIVIHEEMESKKTFLKDLRDLFHEMDADGNGILGSDEFHERLGDEQVIAYFSALKLDITDTVTLFQLLDVDGSAEVDISEFIEGCYALQGEARSIDVKIMKLQLQWLVMNIESLVKEKTDHGKAMVTPPRARTPLQVVSVTAAEETRTRAITPIQG